MSALAVEMPATWRSLLLEMKGLSADLLWHYESRPLRYVWLAKNRWPKLAGWFWDMVHRAEWQKSTAQSVLLWIVATPVIFDVARRLGHGVTASVLVSFLADLLVFGLNKLWIWHKRNTSLPRSGRRNLVVWGVTLGINFLLATQVIGHFGLHTGRYALGVYGMCMNPVMFQARDKFVFSDNVREWLETAAARRMLDMRQAVATGYQVLGRIGRT